MMTLGRFVNAGIERRKRALTLAVLTRPRYAAIFEPGCANGELSFRTGATL